MESLNMPPLTARWAGARCDHRGKVSELAHQDAYRLVKGNARFFCPRDWAQFDDFLYRSILQRLYYHKFRIIIFKKARIKGILS